MQRRSLPLSADTLDQHVVHPEHPLKFDQKIGQSAYIYGSVYVVELDSKPRIAKRLLDILMGRGLEEPVGDDVKDVCHQRFLQECVLLNGTHQHCQIYWYTSWQ